uniref:Uncharacterized protein n=1 Tax=Strombidium inclinatum TaxID=197538 RepID=A0A7S3IRX3_9SPIT
MVTELLLKREEIVIVIFRTRYFFQPSITEWVLLFILLHFQGSIFFILAAGRKVVYIVGLISLLMACGAYLVLDLETWLLHAMLVVSRLLVTPYDLVGEVLFSLLLLEHWQQRSLKGWNA